VTVLWVVLAILVLLALYAVATYNGLVRRRTRVDAAWSQIDVQLQRRRDLIPNLVEAVKGYASHERAVLQAVTEARAAAMGATGVAGQAQAENAVTGALRQLLAVAESYPDLKANQNFLALQEELESTEGKIAYARQFYNESVASLNAKIQSFPANLLAGRAGFTPREYFEADERSRDAVRVEL
jgi:LemA protein